jgi:hypothetical protein
LEEKDMRKLLVLLLALGLVLGMSMTAAAATDVSVSGTYWVRGYMASNWAMQSEDSDPTYGEVNQAFYAQRLRIQPVFNVSEGLTLTVRFDALERIWGADAIGDGALGSQNVRFGRAYITYKSPIGKFDVGYMSGGTWGTVFQDDTADGVPRIKYTGVFGPMIVLALTEKGAEGDGPFTASEDADYDKYALAGIYRWDGGQAGVLFYYLPWKGFAGGNADFTRMYLAPYFKANVGPVYLEGEASYYGGEIDYDPGTGTDVDLEGYSWYLYAKYNMGPAYVGAQYAHVDGDDPTTDDEQENGYPDSADWDPCLILFDYWTYNYIGNLGGASDDWKGLTNGDLYQVFAGFSPMENLTLHASLTYAVADEKPLNYVDDDYGYEVDITATWKIVDNLEYMIGFGYLFAGDFFKKDDANAEVEDNYLLMNKLQLNF